jgi:hypothetical protein
MKGNSPTGRFSDKKSRFSDRRKALIKGGSLREEMADSPPKPLY